MSLPRSFLPKFIDRETAAIETYYQAVAVPTCESPIEATLMTALYAVLSRITVDIIYGEPSDGASGIFIIPQAPIGNYRADFLIGMCGRAGRIVVECDGHQFHERTKEQAERDRRRDREMQRLGFQVFRFTGSEIYRDAFSCATEIASSLLGIDRRLL